VTCPSSVDLDAIASDPDDDLDTVRWYIDDVLMSASTTSVTFTQGHTVRAVAYDERSATTTAIETIACNLGPRFADRTRSIKVKPARGPVLRERPLGASTRSGSPGRACVGAAIRCAALQYKPKMSASEPCLTSGRKAIRSRHVEVRHQ
jgi:hypothetical protein